MIRNYSFSELAEQVARTNTTQPDANWNEAAMIPTRSAASASQIVRRQLMEMGIPFQTVRTAPQKDGSLLTWVHAFDVASVAEALRTLHPEHTVAENGGYASMVSDGRL